MEVIAEDVQKKAYAELLLSHPGPYEAAFALFPSNSNRALRVASEWVADPIVIEEIKRLKSNVEKPELPTKHDLASAVWKRMQGAIADEDFVKLAKLYGDVNGFIEKPMPATTNVNIQQNKVMTVRDFGDDANWEARMLDQQRRLASGQYRT